MTRSELIDWLQMAPCSSHDLDFWCWWYGKSTEARKANPQPPSDEYVEANRRMNGFHPTLSVDDALRMVPDEHMWFLGNLDPSDMQFVSTISRIENVGGESWRGYHRVAPIAMCIAALKARG